MLADQQNQISDNRNQISATNNNLSSQVGVLQGQINNTNSTLSNLTSVAEALSNKSTATDLGGANPSDQLYPSQKAAKTYVDQSISQIASSGVPDATTVATGKIQLSGDLGGTATNPLVPALANKANIASPVFTGTPVLPSGTTGVTQSSGDNSTKLATTAFVTDAVGGLSSGSSGVPYTGATGPVDLGGYDLTANGIVIGIGGGDNTNTSIGNASMRANSGVRNTAFGNASLQANTVGTDNTAVGYFALQKNTATTNPTYIGSYNTAVGSYSLQSHTTGTRNTGIGAFSLQTTSTGYDNSAFGYSTLKTNTTGYRNTANGSYTLYFNQTGNENIALGWYSLQQNTSGSGNTALGTNSLKKNTTGNYNTALGYQADTNLSDLSNATAIGYNAKANASNSIVLGNSSVKTIGGQVTWTTNSDIRIKKNIRDTHYGLSTVMQLRPVEYTLISSDLKQVGFIAQEVNKLVPEVVTGTEGDLEKGEILGITYANLVAVLTKAIQEQQKQIEDLHQKLEVQGKKMDYLITIMDAKK
jgi:regulator of RNase E activity RraB